MAARLTRRTLLSEAVAFMAVPAHAQSGDAAAFVRDFYIQEVARHAAQANRNKANVPLGPIFHIFFGQGALPGREIKLGAVTPSGGDAVSVALTIQGHPRQLVVHTVREGGAWKFADIDYGSGESFIAYFRRRAGL